MKFTTLALSYGLLAPPLAFADQTPPETTPTQVEVAIVEKEESQPKNEDPLETKKNQLALENALQAEKTKKELADLQAKLARLKAEKEILAEKLALTELKQKAELIEKYEDFRLENERLKRESTLAKLKAETLAAELKAAQTEAALKLSTVETELKAHELQQKRESFVSSEPIYLDDPLREDGTLVISDRRIELNGGIWYETADHITERINYFNNKDPKKPIFIVIGDSPGGSVMAGMRILKAMEGSEAPVYVVVKSFAASMAAGITTMAERSFAYPNAVLLHHQVLSFSFGNLTETREHTRDLEEWWRRLATPIAKKMGISREEFIKKMYQERSTGDWTEFADQAQKIGWVDHVVENIHETALLTNPDAQTEKKKAGSSAYSNHPGNPRPSNIIPRLNPKDLLYLYNPDGYYKPAQ